MNKLQAYITLLVFIFVQNVYLQDCKSFMNITTNRNEYYVFIDDVFVNKGKAEVEIGRHILKVKESLTKWNAFVITDTIEVLKCGKEYVFNYNFRDEVMIDTNPQNAEIIYKDSTLGYTPGYVERESLNDIKFKIGENIFTVDYESLNANKIQQLQYAQVLQKASFTDSQLFKVLIGSAVILGGTAAYLKIQADKKYDNYLISKDKSALEEIDKLDLYSGVSLGLLQINIGYLFYRLLID